MAVPDDVRVVLSPRTKSKKRTHGWNFLHISNLRLTEGFSLRAKIFQREEMKNVFKSF